VDTASPDKSTAGERAGQPRLAAWQSRAPGVVPQAIGFDVGGTAVKAGRIGGEGRVQAELERPLPRRGGFGGLVALLAEMAAELGPAVRIGLGVPGLVDHEAGIVEVSPNIPFLDGQPLSAAVEERLGLELGGVRIVNDANAAALGEAWIGAGAGRRDMLFVTLGTGVGGGLVLGGKLWEGAGLAGEIGHVKVERDGELCGCGRRGCLETLASATAASRRAKLSGLPAAAPGDLVLLAEAARRAPGPERDLLDAVGRDLGFGLAAVLNLLDLRTYVFGGGFGRAFDTLESGIRDGLDEGSYGARLGVVELLPARLGPRAGWIGAARVALDAARTKEEGT